MQICFNYNIIQESTKDELYKSSIAFFGISAYDKKYVLTFDCLLQNKINNLIKSMIKAEICQNNLNNYLLYLKYLLIFFFYLFWLFYATSIFQFAQKVTFIIIREDKNPIPGNSKNKVYYRKC